MKDVNKYNWVLFAYTQKHAETIQSFIEIQLLAQYFSQSKIVEKQWCVKYDKCFESTRSKPYMLSPLFVIIIIKMY